MRAGVGLVTRVGGMEGGDDVQAIAAFGEVELWIAWLDPCSCFKSRTRISFNLGYLTLHTTGPWSLFAGVDYLLPGLYFQSTLLIITKDRNTRGNTLQRQESLYYNKHGLSGACFSALSRRLLVLPYDYLHEQCSNAYSRPSGQSP